MELINGPIKSALKICLYGVEGIGKSTLASKFPNPVFIDTEGSTSNMDVTRTPAPSSWTTFMEQIRYFKNNPNLCDTLIIDTADWAERMCIEHICAIKQIKGIEDMSYGRGYVYLAEEFGRFLNLLDELRREGVHIVLTAHAMMRKFEQPDETGAYDRWELKLQKRIAPLVKEWADMVLFINYKTFVVNSDGNGKGTNKAQGGKRVMYTSHHPCWDAKNRHGLQPELPLDYNEIAYCIVTRNVVPASMCASVVRKPETVVREPQPLAMDLDDVATPEPVATKAKQEPLKIIVGLPGVPQALADLMIKDGVTIEEIQTVVGQKGYFPTDTPIANYPIDFVNGCLVGAWPRVYQMVLNNRNGGNNNG